MRSKPFLAATLFATQLGLLASPTALAEQPAQPIAAKETSLSIAAQPMPASLAALAAQTGIQLVFPSTDVPKNIQAPAIQGRYTPQAALKILLADSGLRDDWINSRLVAIRTTRPEGTEPASPAEGTKSDSVSGQDKSSSSSAAPRSADPRSDAPSRDSTGPRSATPDQGAQLGSTVEEILVTAEKRGAERLQDVPIPMTALNGESLVQNNQVRIQDFFASVPALNLTQDFRGGPILSIRGISSGALSNPTIGIVVDDVPYGASTSLGGGFTAPDFDPSDLARLEILRGPQGTLYGANSIGGLLKYVTIDPSTDRLSGSVSAGLSSVAHGEDVGYNVRGAVNAPISDTFALRASGFTRRDPGYIDNPALGIRDVNVTDAHGGRLSALWRPNESFSLKLSALLQNSSREGAAQADVLPGMGDLQQNFPRGTGTYDSKIRFYSATANLQLGNATITSLTGYADSTWSDNPDYSHPPWGGTALSVYGVSGASLPEDNTTRKITQEVRLTTPLGSRVDWLVGAFYTHEKTDWYQQIVAVDPVTGAVAGVGLDYTFGPTVYDEYALFTDFTFHVTDRLDVQLGGRGSSNDQKHDEQGVYPFFNGFVFAPDTMRTSADAFTYLLTPRFKVSKDLMLYSRIASGYRAGGPNYLTSATNFPLGFAPDKTQNYEVGIKGDVPGTSLSFDASVYYIDWKDLQVLVPDPPSGLSGYVNAGRAKSQGVELSLDWQPLNGLSIAAWVAWNDAKLTEDFPAGAGNGVSGDRLPYTSKWSGTLSIDDTFSLTDNMAAFLGSSLSYVGDRASSFTTTFQSQQRFAGYAQLDLRAGIRREDWTITAFATNVADRRGILTVNTFTATNVYYIQPRTIGLSVARTL